MFPRCIPPSRQESDTFHRLPYPANNGGWGVPFHQVTHDWSLSAGKVRAMSYAHIWPALVALRSGNAPGEKGRFCEIWIYPQQKTAWVLELLGIISSPPLPSPFSCIFLYLRIHVSLSDYTVLF